MDNPKRPASNAAPMSDRTVIDAFTRAVLAGDASALTPHFGAQGIATPSFRWNPTADDLEEAPLKALHRWWHDRHPEKDGLPSVDAVDPVDLREALGHLMILDVLEDGWDYRYRLYGSEIARFAKRDYTGQRTSDLKVLSLIPAFYIACYRAVLARPEPLMTRNQPPTDVATVNWTRLVLPLIGADGKIARFLVGNVPGTWRQPRDNDSA